MPQINWVTGKKGRLRNVCIACFTTWETKQAASSTNGLGAGRNLKRRAGSPSGYVCTDCGSTKIMKIRS